jgi:hypothetical protein
VCVCAQIIVKVATNDPDTQLLLAVDNGSCSLADVVGAISASVGSGVVEPLSPGDADAALLRNDDIAHLQANLKFDMEGSTVAGLGIDWVAQVCDVEVRHRDASIAHATRAPCAPLTLARHRRSHTPSSGHTHYLSFLPFPLALSCPLCVADYTASLAAQDGFVASIAAVRGEYIAERRLRPVRVAVVGPPASGKSSLADSLARRYFVPVVRAAEVVAAAVGTSGVC